MKSDPSESTTRENTTPISLSDVVKKNVEVVADIEKAAEAARTPSDRIADKIAGFCGSMYFVWFNLAWFSVWIGINTLPFMPKSLKFDPPPFGNLTLIVSLEAIFLSLFILISQNRQQEVAEHRNELDLQINLLAEQESTHTILLLTKLLEFHGIEIPDREMEEALKSDTNASKLAESVKQTLSSNNG